MRHRRQPATRRGATAVELALTAPLFFLLIFGGMEFSRANMIRNAAGVAVLEGARAGILPGATSSQCIAKTNAELAVLNIQGGSVSVLPTAIDQDTPEVTVTVSIPLSQNALPLSKFVIGKQLVQSIKLKREID
ncbi:MAG: pilus assembly protein [Pirellulaceae bacterium]